jgi:hypothetical protein
MDWIGTYDIIIGPTGAGASGSIAPDRGAQIRSVNCHVASGGAAGSLQIGTASPIIVPAGTGLNLLYEQGMLTAGKDILSTNAIVATGTDAFFVEIFESPGT